uniref:group II intron reverse transcriptase/maturase mat1 n=1 Tax=Euglena deses TaxID=66845 RepID=UPI0023AB41F8|nr:group II intron reverse transcriptase/maturase mat1 [Euglena deses]WCH63393.1 group II intron reverse transcriptase/maturase mat1 [Euglena deses]
MIFLTSKILSWEKASSFIFKLQKRLFKSVYVHDLQKIFSIQKLILNSNSARLLAIREVTQISYIKKIAGVDGKTSLTFLERFELNENLKFNFQNWFPQSLKKVDFVSKEEITVELKISTISDRAWQALIKLAIEPAHEAIFSPCFFGFRLSRSIYEVQNSFFLNLSADSFGLQKRILKLNLNKSLSFYNYNYLVDKIISPRSIKLGIFRSLKKGIILSYLQEERLTKYEFCNLLYNVFFDGLEQFGNCIRFSNTVIFFLKPFDNEKKLTETIKKFLYDLGLSSLDFNFDIISVLKGFDFLYWNFKLAKNGDFLCTPSLQYYKIFLKRVKRIINNSNYGSEIKVSKLSPIIREWYLYNKFSNLKGVRFSLFYIKKRCFRLFNKESKQDFYSSKRLVDNCFLNSNTFYNENFEDKIFSSPYFGHFIFWNKYHFVKLHKDVLINNYYCIHCGMNFSLY